MVASSKRPPVSAHAISPSVQSPVNIHIMYAGRDRTAASASRAGPRLASIWNTGLGISGIPGVRVRSALDEGARGAAGAASLRGSYCAFTVIVQSRV